MYFILKYIKSDIKLLIIGMISSILGYLYCILLEIVLPWAVEVALVAILFFIVGYLFKIKESKYKKIFELKYLFILSLVSEVYLSNESITLSR